MAARIQHQAVAEIYPFADLAVPARATVEILTTQDGRRLRAARFAPSTDRVRGTILIVQGRAEYIEKYYETIEDFRERGFAVAIYDWRGQGGSDRITKNRWRAHVGDFDEYGRDLDTVVEDFLLADCPPPYFAVGHSTGGTILLLNADRLKLRLERLALSAPLLRLAKDSDITIGRALTAIARSLVIGRRVLPWQTLQPYPRGDFNTLEASAQQPYTTDKKRHDRQWSFVQEHPEICSGPPTLGWIGAAISACDTLMARRFPESLTVPTVMAAALRDTVVSVEAIEEFGRRMRVGRTFPIDRARHEIMMESNGSRDEFLGLAEGFFMSSERDMWE